MARLRHVGFSGQSTVNGVSTTAGRGDRSFQSPIANLRRRAPSNALSKLPFPASVVNIPQVSNLHFMTAVGVTTGVAHIRLATTSSKTMRRVYGKKNDVASLKAPLPSAEILATL